MDDARKYSLINVFHADPKSEISFSVSFFFFFFNLFIIYFWLRWVFTAATRAFSSCGKRGLLFVAVLGLLVAVASLVAEHGL